MPYPTRAPTWLRYLRFWKSSVKSDIDAELQFHFDARIDELTALGDSRTAAHTKASYEFGDLDQTRRALQSIDTRIAQRQSRIERLRGWRDDAAYGIRSLLRTPAVTLTIIVTLALGLGMNAAMFSFLDQVFARAPGGVVRPESFRRLWWVRRSGEAQVPAFWSGFDYPVYRAVTEAVGDRARTTLYEGPRKMRLGGGENPPQAQVVFAGAGYFELLGVTPEIGRLFSAGENRPGAGINVAVVSDAYWHRELGGDSAAIGRRLTVENQPYTIVGISKRNFTGLDLDATDIWLPLGSYTAPWIGSDVWWQSPNVSAFRVLLQLKPGAGERQVADRATLALRTYYSSAETPWRKTMDSVDVARLGSIIAARGPGEKGQEVRVATRLAGVAAIVFIIACANVINLLLARAVRRRREIAVRLALGISRSRLIRLLVVESVMLALVAAAAAVLAAQWGGSLLRSLLLPDVHWATSTVNWHVAALAIGLGLVAGIVAGLVPALQASRPDLTVALRGGPRDGAAPKSRLRSTLVVAQAALSVMLLAGAALFVKSLQNVHDLNLGFVSDQLVFGSVRFDVPDSLRDQQIKPTIENIAERLRRMGGVERVAVASMQPMSGFSWLDWFTDKQFPKGKEPETFLAVSPQYFAATGLRVIRGSGFPDVPGAAMPRVMVINDAMAKAIWPGENAIGRCMRFGKEDAPCYTITGIVETARRDQVIEDAKAQYYMPIDNMPPRGYVDPTLIVRASPDHIAQIEGEIRREIKQAWPSGIPHVTRMADALERQYRPWRLGATLFTTFGLLALIIAGVGIFSTVSYGVSQRTHEFGVRVALGAQTSDVVRLVIGGGLRTVAVGVVIGIGLALAGGRLIESLLYGIKPSSPAVIAIVAAILLGVSAIAAFAPAWRAARVDPVNALRAD
jgi:predicted permease